MHLLDDISVVGVGHGGSQWQWVSDGNTGLSSIKEGERGRKTGRISDCRTILGSFQESWWEVFSPNLPIKGASLLTGSSQSMPSLLHSVTGWEKQMGSIISARTLRQIQQRLSLSSVPLPWARDLRFIFTWPHLASEVMHLLSHGILYKQAVRLPRYPEGT